MRRIGAELIPLAVLTALGPRLLRASGRRPFRPDCRWKASQLRFRQPRRSPSARQRCHLRLSSAPPLCRKSSYRVWPLARVGRHWFRRPASHWQSSRRSFLSSGLDRLGLFQSRHAGLAHGRAPAVGRNWSLRAGTKRRTQPVAGHRRRGRVPGIAVFASPVLRGALSSRLVGVLVSLGVLGSWPALEESVARIVRHAADPGNGLSRRPPTRVVLARHRALSLGWGRCDEAGDPRKGRATGRSRDPHAVGERSGSRPEPGGNRADTGSRAASLGSKSARRSRPR